MKIKVRPALVLWHRWFGVFAAIWLLAMAVTGSVLVFYGELDRALNADLYVVESKSEPNSEAMSARDWIRGAELAKPDSFVQMMHLPEQADATVLLQLSPRPAAAEKAAEKMESAVDHGSQVFVDPYTGEVVGERQLGVLTLSRRHIMNVLYELHLDLLLGEPMLWFLGLVALLWLIDHIVSLLLSFTTLAKWKQSFRIRFSAGGYKCLFDLHRAGGLWLFPITLMFAVSGLYFNWYGSVVKVVDSVSPLTPRYIFTLPNQDDARIDTPIDMAEALSIAREAIAQEAIAREAIVQKTVTQGVISDARADMVRFLPRKQVYELRFFDPRDIDPYGRRMVVIDALNGQMLSDRHITEGSAGNTFLAWQYPLHSGKAFGWPGRILVFLSGIMLVLAVVTGVKIWLRKRRVVRV